ncbi:MAG: choice-of-anchor J domain-containing protein [Candidatus Thermoplasmatota archaeon]|nr:choice-of-anchor J domain-containing protein [Candidatus Thermoplasmatota archaeon]
MAGQANQSARCLHDPSKTSQDEWLITPTINLSGLRELYLQFNWFMSYFWSVNPYHNYDLNVYFVNENKSDWQLIWNQNQVGPFENWVWYTTAIDLSTYQNGNLFRIGFQYNGSNGAQVNIDDIVVYRRIIRNPPIVDAGGPYEGYIGEEINFYGNAT